MGNQKSYLIFKSSLDIIFALLLLIPLSLIMVLIGFAVKLDSQGPILFRQRRIGKDCKEFVVLKFRTMRIDTPSDTPTHLMKAADNHITRVGGILRKTSLDELPQLINIIKGEMSFIGPRPALWNQFDLIELRNKNGANSIKPGITGLAQISGRDELSIEKKAELDGVYSMNMSFINDIKIFLRTIISVIKSEGISEGHLEN